MRKRLAFLVGLLLVLSGSYMSEAAGQDCPYNLGTEDVEMEIVNIIFTDHVPGVTGNRMTVEGERLEKFRIAIVTVKVKKPAGKRLSVAAADLTLHYEAGSTLDVAPCEGLSTFSQVMDMDRPINLPSVAGPGWVKQTTGARCTQADEVYFDATFRGIEPEIGKVWLCVGQPTTTTPFISRGWKP